MCTCWGAVGTRVPRVLNRSLRMYLVGSLLVDTIMVLYPGLFSPTTGRAGSGAGGLFYTVKKG